MRVVVALGGNALLKPGDSGSFEEQENSIRELVSDLEDIQKDHELIVTHGNGPQVGNLLIQQDEAKNLVPEMPLDVCVAMTQGQIGYLIRKNLDESVGVLTHVEVDESELEKEPTKPVGPYYDDKIEENMVKEPEGWRKVVVSPKPEKIVELDSIRNLVDNGFTVVCCGGGGIPVTGNGRLDGEEAVVDKDRITSLLAKELEADVVIFYTDVDHVYRNYGDDNEEPIEEMSLEEAREILSELDKGSMKPKLEAAIDFIGLDGENRGRKVVIGNELDLSGDSGTLFANDF